MGYKRVNLLSSETPLKTKFFYYLLPKEKPLKGGSVSTPIVLALTYLSKAIFSDKITKRIGTCKINRGLLHGVVGIEVAHLVGE